MRQLTFIFCLLIAATLCSCASYDFSRRVVQQGNLLPDEKLSRLHLGMSKEDVSILMGTSLLSPDFNNDHWDYAYTLRRGSDKLLVKNISLTFNNGRLSKIEKQP